MVFYALAATAISAAFALTLWVQYRSKPRPYLLAWSVALAIYAVAALTEVIGAAAGWSPLLYRTYYYFGGILVVGVLAALLEASKSGKGQVVDTAMCDGAASLMSMFFDMKASGRWVEGRESNFLDGGAHFYGVYECSCGNFISIGSIEPQFYALLREHAGLSETCFDAQMDRKAWPELKAKLTEVFKTRTRDDWCKIMEGTDICFAPILTMAEAPKHPHMAAREVFVTRHGVTQPAPAPRFSRTSSAIREPETAEIGEIMSAWKAGR